MIARRANSLGDVQDVRVPELEVDHPVSRDVAVRACVSPGEAPLRRNRNSRNDNEATVGNDSAGHAEAVKVLRERQCTEGDSLHHIRIEGQRR